MPTTAINADVGKKFIGAVKDEWRLYSNTSSDYTIGAPIGFGASTPNVLRVRGTWTEGHKLYIALRLMKSGSAADVMRYGWPGGMEEEVVRCILKQALEGLNYLHVNGLMHRDVKAANFLIDEDGTVLLGDLGVAAFLWENEDTTHTSMTPSLSSMSSTQPPKGIMNHRSAPSSRQSASHHPHRPRVLGKRKSFVGTPCWMAPEVINGKQYDASADIWSFGITALELTQGRAPRSRESPHNVLLHIVQNEPPKLERESGPHKYSPARPTAEELLQSSFFKGAKKKGYLVNTILKELPPLAQRQERRKQPSIMTHRTIDSWDFSLSPTTSVYGPHPIHRSIGVMPAENVAEIIQPEDGEPDNEDGDQSSSENREHEEGAAAYAQRMRTRHNTTQHAPRPHLGRGTSSRSILQAIEPKLDQGSLNDRPEPCASESPLEGSLAVGSGRPDTSGSWLDGGSGHP
ncbi:hypothetical protein QCA50_001432 [Cerrena zonata]|uniref:Protein kinase domain-containing protein n=1 Tax=Cerrena zonata TaxID=2478898 RepID=A0AAW0GNM1_9APHY